MQSSVGCYPKSLPGQSPMDRHDITACVFRQKLKSLMDFIVKHEPYDKITSNEIDDIIFAEIPDADIDKDFYEVVTKNMIHGPCAANLLLQRDDIVAKRVDGKLLVAPCKPKGLKSKVNEFKGEIINKFELERINAELEILAQKQDTTKAVYNQLRNEILWEQISQRGEELAEQLKAGFGKATELIQEEL
ncbi:unnamed protein product [Onchocerca ochengi]|uniref:RRF domain-containing protein n=1 Tax=Onchocerca ochengi TaxID=42157 RepID=A0A182ELM9_ONCOC|nr:unnamed protein product [Onchocerca ochengi]